MQGKKRSNNLFIASIFDTAEAEKDSRGPRQIRRFVGVGLDAAIQFPNRSNVKKAVTVYRAVFFIMLIVGAVTDIALVWDISDTLNGLMAAPNLLALVLLSPKVFGLVREYFHKPFEHELSSIYK